MKRATAPNGQDSTQEEEEDAYATGELFICMEDWTAVQMHNASAVGVSNGESSTLFENSTGLLSEDQYERSSAGSNNIREPLGVGAISYSKLNSVILIL